MTILTRLTYEKNPEKVPLPLSVENVESLTAPSAPHLRSSDGGTDNARPRMVFRPRRISPSTTIFLFLSALSVTLMGILGGMTIYRLYAPSMTRMYYRGVCDIPYYGARNGSLPRLYDASPRFIQMYDLRSLFPQLLGNASEFNDIRGNPLMDEDVGEDFFRERFELDLSDAESYSKIEVPDFRDGRRGRFMHDFKENQSAIIDANANRCFIMSLDRETTLPPKSFRDLLNKMQAGYYDINTDRVRKNMRVVFPELDDTTGVSARIANECVGMKVYRLEKYISGVFKREAIPSTESGKFAEFSGAGIVEFNLMNINEIERYEEKQRM